MFKKIKGNIFNSKAQVLVNTVNCVGVMGRGIALECKLRHPKMFEVYKKFCDQRKLNPGSLQLWKNSNPWILNFPTKLHWKDPSKFEYLEKGLDKFVKTYKEKKINSIAFPMLGASLGGLPEDKVFELIKKKLQNLENIDVEVYQFDPTTKDELFLKFYEKVHTFSVQEYKNNLKIKRDTAEHLKNAIDNNQVASMLSIQDIPKIGIKSLENIHNFLATHEGKAENLFQSELDLI